MAQTTICLTPNVRIVASTDADEGAITLYIVERDTRELYAVTESGRSHGMAVQLEPHAAVALASTLESMAQLVERNRDQAAAIKRLLAESREACRMEDQTAFGDLDGRPIQ